MCDARIVPATHALAARMAPHLRQADALEVSAARRWTPLEALQRSIDLTPYPFALLLDGEPVAMWGVEPVCLSAGVGVAWLLGTDALTKHPRLFWRLCKDELARLLQEWRVIFNWIDARYEPSLRWAKHLGFSIDPPRPFGADGAPFCCAAIVR